jgi:hypothetical protein
MSDKTSASHNYINTVCAIAGVIAAFSIPVVLDRNARLSRINENEIAQQTRTWEVMDRLDERIAPIVAQKLALDQKNNITDELSFTPGYIDDAHHRDVQFQVFSL